MKILIKNGTLCTMAAQTEETKGDILIEDGKIAAIDREIRDQDAETIDASGLYVMPGMIDAHTHIGLFDFNNEHAVDDANEMTNPVTIAVDARYGVNPKAREFRAAYEHGITTLLITPGSGDVFCGLPFALKTYGDNVFDMSIKAPCAVKIALGGNPKNTYGDRKQLPMTRMGVAHVLRDTFRRAKEYLEKKERQEKVDYDADMEALCLALEGEIPCKVHCTQYDMLTAIEICKEFGVRFSLEHAWGATDYIDEIAESGCDVCYGPQRTGLVVKEEKSISKRLRNWMNAA